MADTRILDRDAALIEAHKFFDKKANHYHTKFESTEKGSFEELKAFAVYNELNEIRNNLWLCITYGSGNTKVSIDRKRIWTAYTVFQDRTTKCLKVYEAHPYGDKGRRAYLNYKNSESIEDALCKTYDSLAHK